jgi:glucosamine--fructose-6-phosphate aminotransferase (isomerizing)
MLPCGLAGILAIKGVQRNQEDIVGQLAGHFHNMLSKGLENASAEEFLGQEHLHAMEKALYALKQDIELQHMLHTNGGLQKLRALARDLDGFVQGQETLLEQKADRFTISALEVISSRLIQFKDILWGLKEDLLKNQDKILSLCGADCLLSPWVFRKYQRLNFLLNALDRLEVRGRDSSGVQIAFQLLDGVTEKVIQKIKDAGLSTEFLQRLSDGDLMHGSINLSQENVTFTYKTASITGELGKNCRELREAIKNDAILKAFVYEQDTGDMYLAHTRWASVGAINIPNCHPVNNFTIQAKTHTGMVEKEYPFYGKGTWFINVALNGDIDNYQAIKASAEAEGRLVDQRVTTDTKVIPLAIEKYLLEGDSLKDAFRKAVTHFEGSHAIAMESNLEPGKIFLALHGSGQALFVGIARNQLLFASEVYGLVEETPYFIKMDGEKPRIQGDPQTMGQIFILSNDKGQGLSGIEALYYDGDPFILTERDIKKAEITTRDIDRGEFRHYLLKEILDAPSSIHKTLLGKYRIAGAAVSFNLGEEVFPAKTIQALTQGKIRNIFVIGQGTAAVAGLAIAEALAIYLKGTRINIQAKKASDLSGFVSEEELSCALVIAVTQSGTTTDTNRAVAMAREKGAHIVAIVNRRQSDITTKAHGVFYTSDGRDIEMSVASTKAFYSQIIAGYVLAFFMAKLLGTIPDETIAKELNNLEKTPAFMHRVIARMDEIRETAREVVRQKKYWAVVGSGTNKVAADEVRIKLSELCYKTISSDIIEDKKHIDLSAEPLILVMAAGSPEIVLEDIVKETAIFKAHAAKVVVIADEGEQRFNAVADYVFTVPRSSFPLSVIMNTLAGHIWGYYAACSLDEQAGLFRDFRIRLDDILASHEAKGYTFYESIEDKEFRHIVDVFAGGFHKWRSGGCLASMNVATASDLTLLLKYATGKLPIEDFREDFRETRVSSSPLDMLDITLGKAIDELARPVDAIRHQAKTVTVGTSRKVEIGRAHV